MRAYTYLLIDFLTVIACFVFSFNKWIRFDRHFAVFLISAAFTGVPLIAWDIWFAHQGIWWFNETYTTGMTMLGLPIEEWLFFVCIPFSSVFTFYCLDTLVTLSVPLKYNAYITYAGVTCCLAAVTVYHDRLYTLVVALFTATTMSYLHFVSKANWIGKASLIYLLLMFGFFPVNGILTGTGLQSPIVNYNLNEIMRVRILTIPIEDFLYGYSQFMLNIYCFVLFKKRWRSKVPFTIQTILTAGEVES